MHLSKDFQIWLDRYYLICFVLIYISRLVYIIRKLLKSKIKEFQKFWLLENYF